MEKDEIIKTKTPKKNIVCKRCKHKLQSVTIAGKEYERYTYGTCGAFENKPPGVLWNGEDCELYEKE